MKKAAKWLAVISLVIFVIDWGIMGMKILNNDYLITTEAYIGLIFFISFWVCVLYAKLADRCPHCGKPKLSVGNYCPYCGKKIN